MQIITITLAISALALALAFLVALYDDDWGLRIACFIISRRAGRVAYRKAYADELRERLREFELPELSIFAKEPER